MLYISSDFPFKRTDFILYQFEVCGKIVRHVQFAESPCLQFPIANALHGCGAFVTVTGHSGSLRLPRMPFSVQGPIQEASWHRWARLLRHLSAVSVAQTCLVVDDTLRSAGQIQGTMPHC